jgi:hypothetical protein
MEVADNVKTLLRREMRLSVPSEQTLKFSEEQMRQMQELIAASTHQTTDTVLQGVMPAVASQCSAAWANVMPLLYLNANFRFPVGLSLEDAYRRWFCAVPPLPPFHLITAKMIPPCESKQNRKTQKSLRSKFAGCMQVIHGLTCCSHFSLPTTTRRFGIERCSLHVSLSHVQRTFWFNKWGSVALENHAL